MLLTSTMNDPGTMGDNLHATVVKATTSLLFYLLCNPPFLPTSFKSRELNKRHTFLDLSPEDEESYLVTDCYPSQYASLPGKAIELLHRVAAHAEELSNLRGEKGMDELIHQIRYRVPEKDSIGVAVDLGDGHQAHDTALLTLLLRVEGSEDDSASYKYDNMVPSDVLLGRWHDSLQEARRQNDTSFNSLQVNETRNRGASQSSSVIASTASYETAANYKSNGRNSPSLEQNDAEIQEGGDYFTDPNDFWAGVDDDDEVDERFEEREGTVEETAEERQLREEEEERRYWARYDTQETEADAEGTYAQPASSFGQLQQRDDETEDFDRSADATLQYNNSVAHDTDTSTVRQDEQEDKDRADEDRMSSGTIGTFGQIGDRSDKQNWDLRRHSPDPESVTGQSMFDAPPHLSLGELERHYRSHDLSQYADSRDQRLARRHSGAGLLPGIHEDGNEDARLQDPIEALALAETQVAVADDDKADKKQVVPRSASMDTLRKLAESNLADSPLKRNPAMWTSGSDADSSSRAGGFRNFLQMAPSVASDSEAGFEAASTTGISMVKLPETVEEDQEAIEAASVTTQHDVMDTSDQPQLDSPMPSSQTKPSDGLRGFKDADPADFSRGGHGAHALDSPNDNEDEDPLMQQLKASILTGRNSRAKATPSPLSSQPISGSFLPGAASDASMIALKSRVNDPTTGLAKFGAGRASSDTSIEVNSTSTDWDRGKPAPHRYSSLLDAGHPSQRITVSRNPAIDQHIRQQKAEALQQHRKRIEQARQESNEVQQKEHEQVVSRDERPTADRQKTSTTVRDLRGLPFADGQISLGGSIGTDTGLGRKALSDTSLAAAKAEDYDDGTLPPLPVAHEEAVSVSPANATIGKSSAEGPVRDFANRDGRARGLPGVSDDHLPPATHRTNLPSAAQVSSQQARADATMHAKRRREYAQGIKRRNESVKMVMKGAWRLMDETAAAFDGSHASDGVERLDESEFLRLAREAVRECIAEKRNNLR
jgi:hypothetical protein